MRFVISFFGFFTSALRISLAAGLVFTFQNCRESNPSQANKVPEERIVPPSDVSLVVLGTAQDAGSPQIGCAKACCATIGKTRHVVSLGLIDPTSQKTYLFEATPDIGAQVDLLNHILGSDTSTLPNAIFLTHAHIGHYTGLMYLGKEAVNAQNVSVYAMPKMASFLRENGPWGQLVENKNISLNTLQDKRPISLGNALEITPLRVPHRDEYSETVGYLISGPSKTALFIPDIDKWDKWDTSIVDFIKKVDYAFLDATFFDGKEINHRDISEIPHPFVIESMALFKSLPQEDRSKIHFIHFNHTNPLWAKDSKASQDVLQAGFSIARKNMVFGL